MTETPNTGAPQPDPGGSPPSVQPPEPSRPDWLPESHWDAEKNAIKPEFGQHYQEVSNFFQTETERQQQLKSRKPEDIKFEVKLPETIKVPDGLEMKIDEKDPRIPIIRELAVKNGWSQDQVNDLVALDAQAKIEAFNAEQQRISGEKQKLGQNADARIAAVTNWAKGMLDKKELSQDEFEEIRMTATNAAGISALEKLMAKATSGVPSAPPGGNTPPKPAEAPLEQRWYGNSQKAG